jgi:ribosomal-protein-serine acetyltransferase
MFSQQLSRENELRPVVSIYCGVENRRSRAVAERLGFQQEGIHRDAEWINDRFIDLVCYAMLAPDWKT